MKRLKYYFPMQIHLKPRTGLIIGLLLIIIAILLGETNAAMMI